MVNKTDTILDLDLYKKYRSEDAPDLFHHVSFKTMNYDNMVNFYQKLWESKFIFL